MKNLITLFCLSCFIGMFHNIFAQGSENVKPNPIYDYSENNLNNTDTIPDFETKPNKLKITGTIFESDGITPAKDILLYIYQADEHGDYAWKTNSNDKPYMHHRAWVKTNANGQYTFYTFVPGSSIVPLTYPRTRGLKQIYPVIKEPGKPEYDYDIFLFDDDPLMTKRCRSKLDRNGYQGILILENKDGIYQAKKDIILAQNIQEYE